MPTSTVRWAVLRWYRCQSFLSAGGPRKRMLTFHPFSWRDRNPAPSAALNPHSLYSRRLEGCFTASAPPKSQNYAKNEPLFILGPGVKLTDRVKPCRRQGQCRPTFRQSQDRAVPGSIALCAALSFLQTTATIPPIVAWKPGWRTWFFRAATLN